MAISVFMPFARSVPFRHVIHLPSGVKMLAEHGWSVFQYTEFASGISMTKATHFPSLGLAQLCGWLFSSVVAVAVFRMICLNVSTMGWLQMPTVSLKDRANRDSVGTEIDSVWSLLMSRPKLSGTLARFISGISNIFALHSNGFTGSMSTV